MKEHVIASLREAKSALDGLLADEETIQRIATAGRMLVDAFQGGRRVFSCGNGGSMCDAMHFAEELSGRYRLDRKGLAATAISDPGHLSCVGNDYGYECVFSRYVEAHGKSGDILVGISTSGTSKNIIRAANVAREYGLAVITLTGRKDTPLGAISDLEICTPGGKFADRVQELHIKVIHILIELVERSLFPSNYTAAST